MDDTQLDILDEHLRTSTEQLQILIDVLVTTKETLQRDAVLLEQLQPDSVDLPTNLSKVTPARPLRNLLGLFELHKEFKDNVLSYQQEEATVRTLADNHQLHLKRLTGKPKSAATKKQLQPPAAASTSKENTVVTPTKASNEVNLIDFSESSDLTVGSNVVIPSTDQYSPVSPVSNTVSNDLLNSIELIPTVTTQMEDLLNSPATAARLEAEKKAQAEQQEFEENERLALKQAEEEKVAAQQAADQAAATQQAADLAAQQEAEAEEAEDRAYESKLAAVDEKIRQLSTAVGLLQPSEEFNTKSAALQKLLQQKIQLARKRQTEIKRRREIKAAKVKMLADIEGKDLQAGRKSWAKPKDHTVKLLDTDIFQSVRKEIPTDMTEEQRHEILTKKQQDFQQRPLDHQSSVQPFSHYKDPGGVA